jgi:pimeloyl-ACP methyl ester carboxylesterase
MHLSPITYHPSRLLLLALTTLLVAGGCAKPPSIGVTSIKARTLSELQGHLLNRRPDVDVFRDRGPFSVSVQNDRPVQVSATEQVTADRYLAAGAEKAPLVIFLHGHDNSKEDHAYQAMHAASWGMHSLAVQLPNTGPWTANGRTLARLVSAIHREPRLIDPRVDASRIVLVGHSFGASAVAVALAEGAPAVGAILLDAAGIGKELPRYLRQVKRPVILLGADEQVTATRNREYFYQFIPAGVAELSIEDATHEHAQFPAESIGDTEEPQLAFVSALTSAAFSLSFTGKSDYAWESFSGPFRSGKFKNSRRK